MKPEDFRFLHPLRVRWSEVDRQDVVFNVNYFLYFDVAVTEYWRSIPGGYSDDYVRKYGADVYAVKAGADFHGPARYDDMLDIGCRAARIGRSSIRFALGVWRGTEHLASGELIYVNADPSTRKSAAWPEAVRAAIVAFEKTRPEMDAPR